MFQFAHFSDIHLGAFTNDKLKQLSFKVFSDSIDLCINRKVNFIIISGDLFDSNLPDMMIIKNAVKKINEARNHGIKFYLVYGSHDYSITETSIIDILEQAGIFTKVSKGFIENDELELCPVVDSNTNATIVGLNGRKIGLEKSYYEILNRSKLEKIKGFKIFVFHGTFSEFKSKSSHEDATIPVSFAPKYFNYYAGGHQHEKSSGNIYGYNNVNYPGTLFGSTNKDIERNAGGQERGFFLVKFCDEIQNIEFIKIPFYSYKLEEYNAGGKNPVIINEEMNNISSKIDAHNKIVIIKIFGKMSAGKLSDIKFIDFKKKLEENGALYVWLNYHLLSSDEMDQKLNVRYESPQEVEEVLFSEYISKIKVTKKNLVSKNGIVTANELLNSIKKSKHPNEKEKDYNEKIIIRGVDILKLNDEFKE